MTAGTPDVENTQISGDRGARNTSLHKLVEFQYLSQSQRGVFFIDASTRFDMNDKILHSD